MSSPRDRSCSPRRNAEIVSPERFSGVFLRHSQPGLNPASSADHFSPPITHTRRGCWPCLMEAFFLDVQRCPAGMTDRSGRNKHAWSQARCMVVIRPNAVLQKTAAPGHPMSRSGSSHTATANRDVHLVQPVIWAKYHRRPRLRRRVFRGGCSRLASSKEKFCK